MTKNINRVLVGDQLSAADLSNVADNIYNITYVITDNISDNRDTFECFFLYSICLQP